MLLMQEPTPSEPLTRQPQYNRDFFARILQLKPINSRTIQQQVFPLRISNLGADDPDLDSRTVLAQAATESFKFEQEREYIQSTKVASEFSSFLLGKQLVESKDDALVLIKLAKDGYKYFLQLKAWPETESFNRLKSQDTTRLSAIDVLSKAADLDPNVLKLLFGGQKSLLQNPRSGLKENLSVEQVNTLIRFRDSLKLWEENMRKIKMNGWEFNELLKYMGEVTQQGEDNPFTKKHGVLSEAEAKKMWGLASDIKEHAAAAKRRKLLFGAGIVGIPTLALSVNFLANKFSTPLPRSTPSVLVEPLPTTRASQKEPTPAQNSAPIELVREKTQESLFQEEWVKLKKKYNFKNENDYQSRVIRPEDIDDSEEFYKELSQLIREYQQPKSGSQILYNVGKGTEIDLSPEKQDDGSWTVFIDTPRPLPNYVGNSVNYNQSAGVCSVVREGTDSSGTSIKSEIKFDPQNPPKCFYYGMTRAGMTILFEISPTENKPELYAAIGQ